MDVELRGRGIAAAVMVDDTGAEPDGTGGSVEPAAATRMTVPLPPPGVPYPSSAAALERILRR